ncbi:hypothetical protein GCM10018784_62420 [Streptomyces hydrogenans]|nr:hypothetical protein GCM10018784_62420 [Streptomyces hydrogenans]
MRGGREEPRPQAGALAPAYVARRGTARLPLDPSCADGRRRPAAVVRRPVPSLSQAAATLRFSTEASRSRGAVMMVEVGYARAWDVRAHAPWRPISVAEARERDAVGP